MGLGDMMVLVDGNRAGGGETKAAHLEHHLRALDGVLGHLDPGRVLVIGDSLDDARAAREVGVPCVLYDGGSHHREELEAAGVPV
jgi:phosphoglycolate phosphatase-like HAD superfamily hydrolase